MTDQGPIFGREAIEKHYADLLQKVHFSNRSSRTMRIVSHLQYCWQRGVGNLTAGNCG